MKSYCDGHLAIGVQAYFAFRIDSLSALHVGCTVETVARRDLLLAFNHNVL